MPIRHTIRCEIYQDRAGEWRWRIVHSNGNVLADSGEGYKRKYSARRAAIKFASLVKQTSFCKLLECE